MNSLNSTNTDPVTDQREINRQLVRYWLYLICALVAAIVIVGGATRLTDSGLSITEWKPLLGIFPPLSSAEWLVEFEKYKLIPQYQQLNKGMSLGEFQFIYWWEWSHRFLGRIIGFAFAIPFILFWITGRLEPELKPRLALLLVLGGIQGFIGWWMVSSGLVERTDVSQYRLAVHLTLACVIFAYALWLARGLADDHQNTTGRPASNMAGAISLATLFQIILGALVAGLNAGFAYNDWPLMDGAIIPDSLFVIDPWWVNFFENIKLVQFTHRVFAYALIALVFINFLASLSPLANTVQKRRSVILLALVSLQAALGIVTLILQVPLGWALFHQAGAIILLGYSIIHWRGLHGAIAGN
ncbi:MAG: heme A synthase [Hyphomicrobiales bacterium]|nr:heme A synthase [Hyphomicrobiales bacterium]